MPPTPLPIAIDALESWGLRAPGLGLALGGAHTPAEVSRRRHWVALAEDLGLHSVWLPEMHFAPGVCAAPLIELAAIAACTTRLRLGTTSLLLPLHPPEDLAAELAALDQLSGGRLLIGLGRGFERRMLEAFEVEPAQKRDRFDASLDRILALWTEGRSRGGPLAPLQTPHPPLAVAAFGPKGLAQAARRGLPYLASPVETVAQLAENQRAHRAGLPAPQRPIPALVMRSIFVSRDAALLEAARESLGREARSRGAHMPAAIRRALASPLEERALIGPPESVASALAALRRRLRVDLLIVRPLQAGVSARELEHSLALLVRDVWPATLPSPAAGGPDR